MDEEEWLADRFEEHRTRLRAMAYRMLGSVAEAGDAVPETWLRISRVQGAAVPDADLTRQRRIVDAFFAAARGGDLGALIAVLDPDVVIRFDGGTARPGASAVVRGAAAVARRAATFARPSRRVHPALVNGAAGVVITAGGEPIPVWGFTVTGGMSVSTDVLGAP